ncbi:hypothetical protein [Bosea sp. RAC05]|uniref:hypothetical protein n=1 Tax=Bosea sp. RAC05 TaxID=1842539 RepID=UPI00083DC8BE|nr:hypothetical protein [Bosea sp. RAC05]AOG07030.1 hypothetical protein BSY19_2678 [Bosea sp. RAC05]
MLDKPAKSTNWPTRNLKPARPLDDIEPVQFHSDATFRSARGEWLRMIHRQGDPAFANMAAVCFIASGRMSFAKRAVCFADQNEIAAELGWGVATVRRALDLAVAWGWLTKVRRPLTTNEYRLSFSRSVWATIELEFTNRMTAWKLEAAKKRIARDAFRSIRSDHMETSDMSEPCDQVRSNGAIRSDHLSSSGSTSDDPPQPSTERLGEGEQDIGDEHEEKKAGHDVIAMLGRGDMVEGQRIASSLAPARLAYMIDLAEREGIVAAATAIVAARAAASPAH